MRIARVFARKTSYCPADKDCYFSYPKINTPKYDEIHISCTFTWDIQRAKDLAIQWRKFGKVRIGGVAIDGEPKTPSIPGMYVKKGVVFTSRGCPNKCSFCRVRQDLIEFDDFPEGNIIQDNNILACSGRHLEKVFIMLERQKSIEFKGGLEAMRITPYVVNRLRGLKIKSLWLACDKPNRIKPLENAVKMLNSVGFTRSHLYCYVLIGDNARENIHRLKNVWNIGCMPFAQLYRPGEYSRSWKRFQRRWAKPMIIRKRNKSDR